MTATRTLQVVTPTTMAFMMKKKKYKFQVEVSLDELVEVPFVSAVLFAKVRLLDGGNFQEISTREEVKDHKVKWGARFEFPCKMTANASTGVLEPCVLRVSVRKEIKGGRSFLKHGFCDINLAELAGAGQVSRRYLLEGYDSRHRSDNSMLKVTLSMNMLSGDILFKVPSPTTKIPSSVGTTEEVETVVIPDGRTPDDYSSSSLAGSVASGSSGFGSLPKKRPALFNSELLSGANAGIVPNEMSEVTTNIVPELEEANDVNTLSTGVATVTCGTPDMLGHSRNSSTTSQMSRASGYSTQHSRQSSSGDSAGHIRSPSWPVWAPTPLTPPFSPPSPSMTLMDPKRNKFWALEYTKLQSIKLNTQSLDDNELFHTPKGFYCDPTNFLQNGFDTAPASDVDDVDGSANVTVRNKLSNGINSTPRKQSDISTDSNDIFVTPNSTLGPDANDILESFARSVKAEYEQFQCDLRKSQSCTVVEKRPVSEQTAKPPPQIVRSASSTVVVENKNPKKKDNFVEIPKIELALVPSKSVRNENGILQNIHNFLTPLTKRRSQSARNCFDTKSLNSHSTPNNDRNSLDNEVFKPPGSPIRSSLNRPFSKSPLPTHKAVSLGSLHCPSPVAGTKRAAFAQQNNRNPSAGSLALSETGSLDRAKSALERRKRTQEIIDLGTLSGGGSQVSGHVEVTRVNPENLIAEIIKSTNLEPEDDAAETSGLQLFIAKDGTAALGSHEVKSQMSSGVQVFKQVVIEEKR
ncbi:uncharacterized protein LOC123291816 isoform X2 [Chrysoperla carnea]|uniref:uncharacterized protein LOC123291816 isoform X2 n=1 Tax=Chrysoperla carnea TaxID=189513 RepID=UPI001D0752C8|nr:uncharacterized protein LOC123291816 isoform X2 [Chrysoperla carnea]